MQIVEQTAALLARSVHAKTLSLRDIAEELILEVERVNPRLNAVVRFDPELIRAEAARVEDLLSSGAPAPLAGVPFTVKDNLWVGGQGASQGSRLFESFIAPQDALCVQRLRAQGAMVLGVTNASEFACKGLTTNKLFGVTRNPWDLSRTPGGSSGGAASAVSAGLGVVALGTDAGGSVRRPAAHVGVVGMKPTPGCIPHPFGFQEPVFAQSVIGIMARGVADVALSFRAMAGHDARDPMSVPFALGEALDLKGLRVAYSPRLGLGFPVDAEVQASVGRAVQLFEQLGAHVEEADPAWPREVDEARFMPLQFAGLAALYGEAWKKTPDVFDPDIAVQIERGLGFTGAEIADTLFLREELVRKFAEFQERFDLLVTPTTPCVAWPVEQLGPAVIEDRKVSPRGHAAFTPLFNHLYVPACSVPCGLSADGLPMGLQVVGRRYEDALVLAAAEGLEQAQGGVHTKPRIVGP